MPTSMQAACVYTRSMQQQQQRLHLIPMRMQVPMHSAIPARRMPAVTTC